MLIKGRELLLSMATKKDEVGEIKEAVSGDKEVIGESEKNDKEARLIDIPGVGPGAVAKLEAAGIYELMGLACFDAFRVYLSLRV